MSFRLMCVTCDESFVSGPAITILAAHIGPSVQAFPIAATKLQSQAITPMASTSLHGSLQKQFSADCITSTVWKKPHELHDTIIAEHTHCLAKIRSEERWRGYSVV